MKSSRNCCMFLWGFYQIATDTLGRILYLRHWFLPSSNCTTAAIASGKVIIITQLITPVCLLIYYTIIQGWILKPIAIQLIESKFKCTEVSCVLLSYIKPAGMSHSVLFLLLAHKQHIYIKGHEVYQCFFFFWLPFLSYTTSVNRTVHLRMKY